MQRNLFRHGVGGHDGACGLLATRQPTGHLVNEFGDAGEHLVHRQSVADQAGRTHRDLDRAGVGAPFRKGGGDGLGGGVGVLEALRAGARIRAAGVEDHGAQPAGGEDLLRPQHRRRLDLIAGEDGRAAWSGPSLNTSAMSSAPDALMPAAIPVARKPAGAVTPCVRTSRAVSDTSVICRLRLRNHGETPTIESPSVSGQSNARFIDCTAAPPVPLTRLSMAAMPMKVFASSSTATAS